MAGNADDQQAVAEQAAADVAQVIRGKSWLRRIVEVAESAARQQAVAGAARRPVVPRRAAFLPQP